PDAFNSSTSGPPSAATSARAPDCNSARAISTAERATGPSRNAGTICNIVAPASVRGGRRCSKTALTRMSRPANRRHLANVRDGESGRAALLPSLAACGQTWRCWNGALGQTEYTKNANVRLLPEIRGGWNGGRGPIDCCARAYGADPRPPVARRIQVRHARDQGASPRPLGEGPGPCHDPL